MAKGSKTPSVVLQKVIYDKVILQYKKEPIVAYKVCASVIKSIEYKENVLHDDEYL